MSYDQQHTIGVRAEAADEQHPSWAWAVYRYPDQMLLLRSRAEYADHKEALDAGMIAATEIKRRLGIPLLSELLADR